MRYRIVIEAIEPNSEYVRPTPKPYYHEGDDRTGVQMIENWQRRCEVELTESEYHRVRHAILDTFTKDGMA